ncbi:MAG: hypothetical protein JWL98_1599 [Xanthomonadaceae bacterium]|nr:hypothetical protein [Xanthomonadaceae bacterium]
MKFGGAVLLMLALAACERAPVPAATAIAKPQPTRQVQPAAPADAASEDPDIATHSASLMGVADDADAVPADLGKAETYRLPGQFAASTSQLWLEQRFGAAYVRVGEVPGAEGDTSRGLVLFPDDATRRAYLYFQDEKRLRGLAMIRVTDTPSRWQLDNGITTGTTLSRLVELNGKPIAFTGFDWDYGGVVNDWKKGRLQTMADGPVRFNLRLDHRGGRYPVGEDTYASNDPRYPRLGDVVIVGEINVSFPGEDDL